MTPPRKNDDPWSGVSVGYSVVSYLLAGVLVGWGIGAGLDRLLGVSTVFMAIFVPVGAALGMYLVRIHHGRDRAVRS